MAEGEKLRVAVHGTGSIGSTHLEVLRAMAGVVPIAVPKRSQRATDLAGFGYSTAGNIDEAKANGAQFCIIATDTGSHVEDGIKAIDAGLSVLVEKPLSLNAADAHRLNICAQKAQRDLHVACVLRFSESLNTFRRLLGQVGDLHSVRIEAQSYLPEWQPSRPYLQTFRAREAEGGVLLDLIHEIDYAGWIFGWPGAVQANMGNLGRLGIAAEEYTELSWKASSGCLVTTRIDYISKPPLRQMRAFGEKGTIVWDGIGGTVELFLEGAPNRTVRSAQTRDEMFAAQACAFLHVAPGYHDSRLAGGDDGVRALAVCDAARRSSESRREEPVEYP